ncbi:MAG TPA: PIN domain-containing protein [Urbifossiella sp.]|jgi:predicted nucleic acid-binding protein|nr:PIN domain-containing protein [Urbifossiella sp.]
MTARVLDTNIVSYIIKRHSLAVVYQPHITSCSLVVSFQTIGELTEGGVSAGWGHAKWTRLSSVLASITIFHSNDNICYRWTEIRLARRSQPIAVADAWIAATALAYNLELVTHKPADFAAIPGLTVITEAP